jgi:PKD repeat protein
MDLIIRWPLSKNEIQNNYIGNVTSVGLVSEWNMDTGSGDTAFDSTGNNDGSIYGANWKTYVSHSYAAGTYQVSLTVRDDNGAMDTISKQVTVSTQVVSVIFQH